MEVHDFYWIELFFTVVYHRNITAVEDQEEIAAYCILTGFDMNPPPMVHEWYFKNEVRFNLVLTNARMLQDQYMTLTFWYILLYQPITCSSEPAGKSGSG